MILTIFRAGFCSLTECDADKANELRLVNNIVENGLFRGKIDDNGKSFVVANKRQMTPGSVKKIEKNVKKSLKNSMAAQNAKIAAQQVGNVVNNYANLAANKQNDKVVKKNVVYQNFIQQANIIARATDKEIIELKSLLEEYGKMKDFKTVSPVKNSKKNDSERSAMKKKMKNVLLKVKQSVYKNLKLVELTLKEVDKAHKAGMTSKQTILKKNTKSISKNAKKQLDNLETEVTVLANFKTTLEGLRTNFNSKLQILKSFAFKLK